MIKDKMITKKLELKQYLNQAYSAKIVFIKKSFPIFFLQKLYSKNSIKNSGFFFKIRVVNIITIDFQLKFFIEIAATFQTS